MARNGRPRSFAEGEVIDAAMDVFWRLGFARSSLMELTQDLALLPGSLYAAFGSKRGLFARVLEHYAAQERVAFEGLGAQGPKLTRLEALLMRAIRAGSAERRGCLLGNSAIELLPDDAQSAEVIRATFGDLEHRVEQALREAQSEGEIGADVDCGVQARLLLVVMQGLHVVARAETEPRRLEDVVRAALAHLAPRRLGACSRRDRPDHARP